MRLFAPVLIYDYSVKEPAKVRSGSRCMMEEKSCSTIYVSNTTQQPNSDFFHMNKKYQPHSAKELNPPTRPYVEWQDSRKNLRYKLNVCLSRLVKSKIFIGHSTNSSDQGFLMRRDNIVIGYFFNSFLFWMTKYNLDLFTLPIIVEDRQRFYFSWWIRPSF